MSLRGHIAREIQKRGPLPFSRYMELCLYHPELGFYCRPREQFGKAGDFYTSSDVHAVFGRLLARQFEEMWRRLGSPATIEVLELGPGRGLFARDVLDWTRKTFPAFWQALRYSLLEQSANLRQRLRQTLADMGDKVSILDIPEAWAPDARATIVFANEFFDALPVEVIAPEGSLRLDGANDRLVETFAAASSAEMDYLDRYGMHPLPGSRSEVGLAAVEMMRALASKVSRGFMVVVDYGYTREELLAGRSSDTVRAFRQHTLCESPYDSPGDQDITASVNFTALRAAALDAGMEAGDLVTQAQFLMGIGEENEFGDAFPEGQSAQERAKVILQLKHLVSPAGMGESFQVLVLRRGVKLEPASGLAGLRYARE